MTHVTVYCKHVKIVKVISRKGGKAKKNIHIYCPAQAFCALMILSDTNVTKAER